jgi:DNA-binding helix-hairpin-helix protein with protein kinase domain
VGDINHSGFLISPEAKVKLIDADSFQVSDGAKHYFCKVGVPEYTPPELQNQPLGGVLRTSNHDAFGLAVVIFQLLFMGEGHWRASVRLFPYSVSRNGSTSWCSNTGRFSAKARGRF